MKSHKPSPLGAARAAQALDLPGPLKTALVAIALRWPNIHPTMNQIAFDLGCSRSHAAERVKALEERGLITVKVPGWRGRATVRELAFYPEMKSGPLDSIAPARNASKADKEAMKSGPLDSTVSGPPDPKSKGRARHITNSMPTSPLDALTDEVAKILRPAGRVERAELRTVLAEHARSPEHARDVAESVAGDALARKAPSLTRFYATRLRTARDLAIA